MKEEKNYFPGVRCPRDYYRQEKKTSESACSVAV